MVAAPLVAGARAASAVAASATSALWVGTCCETGLGIREAVCAALEAGYRVIDTASHYENERDVGEGVRLAVDRGFLRSVSEARVVTKVWFDDMGSVATRRSVLASREALGDALDTVLVHFPGSIDAVQSPAKNTRLRAETWAALEELKAAGVVRALGLSNYTPRHAREHLKAHRAPDVVQLESHLYYSNAELVEVWRNAGVATIAAYSPLASGRLPVLADATLRRIAQERDATPPQVALAWLLARGLVPVIKATSPQHLREDLGALRVQLSDADMSDLDALDRRASVSFDAKLIA